MDFGHLSSPFLGGRTVSEDKGAHVLLMILADLPNTRRVMGRSDHDPLVIVVLASCAVMSGAKDRTTPKRGEKRGRRGQAVIDAAQRNTRRLRDSAIFESLLPAVLEFSWKLLGRRPLQLRWRQPAEYLLVPALWSLWSNCYIDGYNSLLTLHYGTYLASRAARRQSLSILPCRRSELSVEIHIVSELHTRSPLGTHAQDSAS